MNTPCGHPIHSRGTHCVLRVGCPICTSRGASPAWAPMRPVWILQCSGPPPRLPSANSPRYEQGCSSWCNILLLHTRCVCVCVLWLPQADLESHLQLRQLPTSGLKGDLIDRLFNALKVEAEGGNSAVEVCERGHWWMAMHAQAWKPWVGCTCANRVCLQVAMEDVPQQAAIEHTQQGTQQEPSAPEDGASTLEQLLAWKKACVRFALCALRYAGISILCYAVVSCISCVCM